MSSDEKSNKAAKPAKHGTKGKKKEQWATLVQFLGRLHLCQSLKASEINTLLKYFTLREFNDGDILADIGEVGEALYVVVRGGVALVVDENRKVCELVREGPGEMLGFMSFFDRKPRSVRLVACAPDTEVLRLSRSMYKRMKIEHPFIAINLVEHAVINLDCLFRKVSRDFAQFAHHLYGNSAKK
jgi:CRP/FNR family transcriptional regulator, cyclic AMP receptor protein